MAGVVPDGGEKLAALSKALRKAGERELERELDKGVREPLKGLIPKIAASARRKFPKRGGFLRTYEARHKLRVQRRNGGRYPGVRLVDSYPGRITRLNQGVLRRPVFADETEPREAWEWINQPIPAGFFDEPVDAEKDEIRRSVEDALERVVRQVEIDIAKG